ncbi:MAG: cyclic nucleotide-binding domain-containing protein [Acidimicrobiia bacterium]
MDPDRLVVIPLFAALESDERASVAARAAEQEIAIGTVLTEEADLATRFFAIAEGRAAVTTDDGFVTILGPGDLIGEIGAIRRARRTANVVAITRMRVFGLMAWDLRDLGEQIPRLGSLLEDTIDRRLVGLDGQPGS